MNFFLENLNNLSKNEFNNITVRNLLFLLVGARIQQEKGYFTIADIAKNTNSSKQRVYHMLKAYDEFIEKLDSGKYRIGAYLFDKLTPFFKLI